MGPLVVTNVINGSSAIGEKMGAHTHTQTGRVFWGRVTPMTDNYREKKKDYLCLRAVRRNGAHHH